MIKRFHDDDHYANAIFQYAREYAVSIRDICSFVCTDDKHKISMSEPNFPLAAVPRGRWVLDGNNESFQVYGHDFSTISLIPTVILVSDIPERIDESWYRGKACVGIKISATGSSIALWNATEVVNVLIEKFDTKEAVPPVLIPYTDGGPEHRTTYLSVKIAMICSQKYLDLDQFLAVRTAPGHSYRNPAEKINCLLNIDLYEIGCMRQHSTDQFFEQSLSRYTGLGDACKLIEKNSDRNTKLFKECCQSCINLFSETFSRLKLKDEQLWAI